MCVMCHHKTGAMHDIRPYDARSGAPTVAPVPSKTQEDTVEGQEDTVEEEEGGRGVNAVESNRVKESNRVSAEAARLSSVAAKDGAKRRRQAPGRRQAPVGLVTVAVTRMATSDEAAAGPTQCEARSARSPYC